MKLTKPLTALAAAGSLAALSLGLVLPQAEASTTAVTTTASTVRPALATYEIDPGHTTVVFGAQYMGMGHFWGQFTEYSGTLDYDGENADSFKVSLEIPMSSIDTHNDARNDHLQQADWFNAREYPTVKFVSKSLTANDDDTYTLTGDLTLHGVTKEVEAEVKNLAAKSTPRGDRCGFDATFTVDRTEFGVTNMAGENGIGEEITLMVGVQSTK